MYQLSDLKKKKKTNIKIITLNSLTKGSPQATQNA